MKLVYYKTKLDAIKHYHKQAVEAEEDLDEQKNLYEESVEGTKKAEQELAKAREQAESDRKLTEEFKKEVMALKQQNTNLMAALEQARQALKDSGRHSKKEERKDVKCATHVWIKNVGFQDTKFVKGKKLEEFAKRTYNRIHSRLGLQETDTDHYTPETECVHVYIDYIQKVLGERRQYVQTQLFACCMSELSVQWVFDACAH